MLMGLQTADDNSLCIQSKLNECLNHFWLFIKITSKNYTECFASLISVIILAIFTTKIAYVTNGITSAV